MYGDQPGEFVCGYLGIKALSKCYAGVQLGTGERRGVVIQDCVASVSVWFRSKERPRNGIFGFDRARNGTRAKKFPTPSTLQPPPRSFTRPIFRAVFDSRSSFIAPSLQRRLW